jgi:hypothetical protein
VRCGRSVKSQALIPLLLRCPVVASESDAAWWWLRVRNSGSVMLRTVERPKREYNQPSGKEHKRI